MNQKLWLIKAPQSAIVIFLILNILAMLTYPGGILHDSSTIGYSFFNNFLSDLGRYLSWSGEHNFYSQLFFNSAMIMAGFIFSFYFWNLLHVFNLNSGILYWIAIIGTCAGVSGGISMAGVGLTPSDLYFSAHLDFAHWLFRFFFIASLFYTIIIFKTDLIANKYASGFVIFAILILAYILFSELGPDARESITTLRMQVVAQKSILFCFIIAVYIQTQGLKLILDN